MSFRLSDKYSNFVVAKPVWPESSLEEMNEGWAFFTRVYVPENAQQLQLRIAAASLYRVFINGVFAAYGVHRAAHGTARIDEWDISAYATGAELLVAIEVVSYRVDTYYTVNQPAFLQTEILADGQPVLATCAKAEHWQIAPIPGRRQKVQRFSFQRGFVECYDAANCSLTQWRLSGFGATQVLLHPAAQLMLLPHRAALPVYEPVCAAAYLRGQFCEKAAPEYLRFRFTDEIGTTSKGFAREDLDDPAGERWQRMAFSDLKSDSADDGVLHAGTFADYDFGGNRTGFIQLAITCSVPTRFLIGWAELWGGPDGIDVFRNESINVIECSLDCGSHFFKSIEPNTMRFLRVAVVSGDMHVSSVSLLGFDGPHRTTKRPYLEDGRVRLLVAAAESTLRQNASDMLMDCPSRERAGWLADSFYIGRCAHWMWDNCDLETEFLENYLLLPDDFPYIPQGMVPMCYPSDPVSGRFIPQWAMWLILQLQEYAQRGGDLGLVANFEHRVRGLIAFFEGFRNEIGLLEDVSGWNFIEWSHANTLVSGINFPTNWLYSRALEAAAALYGESAWMGRSAQIRTACEALSWKDGFFHDQAVRSGTQIILKPDCTEACQYYAFLFGGDTRQRFRAHWQRMIRDFPAGADLQQRYPQVHRANMLYGLMLRAELLADEGLWQQLLDEILVWTEPMLQHTGTLWEHSDSSASCCHGFASYLGLLAEQCCRAKPAEPLHITGSAAVNH